MIGRTIGHYEVIEKLGDGGMGVVYKARDSNLDRMVALKLLPDDKSSDPEYLRRLTTEAKAASSLNHPNIVTIYEVSTEDGLPFIAMEYVKGRTIDALLPQKGMRLNEALKIGTQIADALAAAAVAGITHRDLKPGNVMVTDSGLVKVLDFGLAKMAQQVAPTDATVLAGQPRTVEGTILGTVNYMSPEQAEGKPVDPRSDIFSFGVLLFEMLTGQRAFQESTPMSTLASILTKDVAMPAEMHREAERILTRCMRKDPARRFQTMADLTVSLKELKEEVDSGSMRPVPVTKQRAQRWPWIVAAFAVLLSGAIVIRPRLTTPDREETPRIIPFTSMNGIEDHPSFSPDGSQIAFDWNGEKEDNTDIYLKMEGAGPPLRLTTDPAVDTSPAWSPDGRWIAFMRRSGETASIRLIPPLGGSEREIAKTTASATPNASLVLAWSPDSKWLAIPDKAEGQPRGLALLSVESGEKRMLPTLPAGSAGYDFWPSFSPDGRRLVFSRSAPGGAGLFVLDLSEPANPIGEPRRIEDQVSSLALTADGREILYTTRSRTDGLWRKSLSDSGEAHHLAWAGDEVHSIAIARKGSRIAFARGDNDVDIWRYEIPQPGRSASPPAKHISSTRRDGMPTFSRDGTRIAFSSDRSGPAQIWVANADGSNAVQVTEGRSVFGAQPIWSPDGKQILVGSESHGALFVVPANGGPERRVPVNGHVSHALDWSHDGKWFYFSSHRNAGLWRVSVNGGDPVRLSLTQVHGAAESPDGKDVYFVRERAIWKVPSAGGVETMAVECRGQEIATAQDGFYFHPRGEGPDTEIHFYSITTGKSRLALTTLKPGSRGMSVSPDGRWLLQGQAERSGRDLMLVENFK